MRTRNDGMRVRIHPRNVHQEHSTTMNRISFKKLARELKKGKCELYMARMESTGNRGDENNLDSAEKVKTTKQFKHLINEYAVVFRQELPDELPPKRAFEIEIQTDPTKPPASRPVIRLSWNKQKELKRQLDELVRKGLIRHYTSPYGAPVVFIMKKEGSLRIVCDYPGLNIMTINDVNQLPLIEETLE